MRRKRKPNQSPWTIVYAEGKPGEPGGVVWRTDDPDDFVHWFWDRSTDEDGATSDDLEATHDVYVTSWRSDESLWAMYDIDPERPLEKAGSAAGFAPSTFRAMAKSKDVRDRVAFLRVIASQYGADVIDDDSMSMSVEELWGELGNDFDYFSRRRSNPSQRRASNPSSKKKYTIRVLNPSFDPAALARTGRVPNPARASNPGPKREWFVEAERTSDQWPVAPVHVVPRARAGARGRVLIIGLPTQAEAKRYASRVQSTTIEIARLSDGTVVYRGPLLEVGNDAIASKLKLVDRGRLLGLFEQDEVRLGSGKNVFLARKAGAANPNSAADARKNLHRAVAAERQGNHADAIALAELVVVQVQGLSDAPARAIHQQAEDLLLAHNPRQRGMGSRRARNPREALLAKRIGRGWS